MQFYWSTLGNITTEAELDPIGESPVNKGTVKKAEVIVEIASRSQSRASSAPLKSNSPIDLEPSKGILSIIASAPPDSDILDSLDINTLKEEAASYDHSRYPT